MRTTLALAIVTLLWSAAAQASPRLDAARAHVNAAFAYFDEGRFEEAARELEAAHALDPVPELQYNLGQCQERLGHRAAAREAYQRYVAEAPRAPDRAEVEARIAALRDAPAVPPPPPPERVVLKTVVIYREPPPPPGRAARQAAYGAAALAAAALAGAAITGALAVENQNAVTNGGNPIDPTPYDGPRRASGELSQQLWIACGVSAGLAAVFGAAGIVLSRTADKVDSEAPRVTLSPALLPGGGGLFARVAF